MQTKERLTKQLYIIDEVDKLIDADRKDLYTLDKEPLDLRPLINKISDNYNFLDAILYQNEIEEHLHLIISRDTGMVLNQKVKDNHNFNTVTYNEVVFLSQLKVYLMNDLNQD